MGALLLVLVMVVLVVLVVNWAVLVYRFAWARVLNIAARWVIRVMIGVFWVNRWRRCRRIAPESLVT